MHFAARPGHHIRPFWIGLVVLGFIIWWPVGVATLAFLIGSAKMMCGHYEGWTGQNFQERLAEKQARFAERWAAKQARWEDKLARRHGRPSTGNRAFDDYRAETLRKLEEEEKEFREFLDRLRFAKDKAEFDDFLAARRNPPAPEAAG